MKKMVRLALSICVLFSINPGMQAQDSKVSIPQRFEDMVEDSESFKQYQLITRSNLTSFLNILNDSLESAQTRESLLVSEVDMLKAEVASLNAKIEVLNADLAESNSKNDTISFLGIPFQKSVYHLIVWTLVLALAVFFGVAYAMYNRSNRLTKNAQKEVQRINNEFEVFRMNAKQKQVKIKRELQTALNKLDEKGIKV
ncbi:MAG: hypothetical protein AAF363_20600 [Bacteroidota bacterium]